MAAPQHVCFSGLADGPWRVDGMCAVTGEGLPTVACLGRSEAGQPQAAAPNATWSLRGTTGHLRYVEGDERATLGRVTPVLGRPEASCAALIPIRKSDAWWELNQDERRAILEARSRHITIGLDYLPAVARKLYHARELGEPFDFLTWFEFAPADAPRFDALLGALRASEEWQYVEREVEVRLTRTS